MSKRTYMRPDLVVLKSDDHLLMTGSPIGPPSPSTRTLNMNSEEEDGISREEDLL